MLRFRSRCGTAAKVEADPQMGIKMEMTAEGLPGSAGIANPAKG
jgi:hypothetical protein